MRGGAISKVYLGDVLLYENVVQYRKYSLIQINTNYRHEEMPKPTYTSIPDTSTIYIEKEYKGYDLNEGKFLVGTGKIVERSDRLQNVIYYFPEKNNLSILWSGKITNIGKGVFFLNNLKEHKLIRNNIEYGRGSYIETIRAKDGTYPDNGAKDGFWYEKII